MLRAERYFFFLNTPFIFPKVFLAVCPTEPADSFALPGVKLSLLGMPSPATEGVLGYPASFLK